MAPPPFRRAEFVAPPVVFARHTVERAFIGPGAIPLANGDILMAAPLGRPPVNFEELIKAFPVPPQFRSRDGGRTWHSEGPLRMEWKLTGMISDGGISLLRLTDGRIALVAHRHLPNNKGGGLPVISFSSDDGFTWTPAGIIGRDVAEDDAWYIMNDRLVQLRSGRLLVPVAHAVPGSGGEGDLVDAACFYSDDGGAMWALSQSIRPAAAPRGMAEACVVELNDGAVLMLARSGTGFLLESRSRDGGISWSSPKNTTLLSPCSSLGLRRLPDGRLIVFYNHIQSSEPGGFFPRCPLVYAVSADEGRSWGEPVMIDDEGWNGGRPERDVIYPSVCFTDEGMVLLYSTHYSDGTFSEKSPAQLLLGGGKRAILRYPTS